MEVIGAFAQIAASAQAAKAHRASGEAEAQALAVNLRRVRASQRAYWSAAGIDSTTGSPTTVANRSYEMFTLDQGADLINTRQQIRTYNNSASAAKRIGRIKGRASILGGVMGAASTMSDYS